MASTSSAPPGSLIQRFIIYHLGLLPSESDGGGLGESASLEESCEYILYYYDHILHKGRSCGDTNKAEPAWDFDEGTRWDASSAVRTDHVTEEAVKFAGLCSALHSLPSSLQSAAAGNGAGEGTDSPPESSASTPDTKEVHLSSSTLIFVPLEESIGVVAVAQIPRAQQQSASGLMDAQDSSPLNGNGQIPSLAGGDPHAIRSMVQQCHALFCLVKGGGVHHRLSYLDTSELGRLEITDDEASGMSTPKAEAGEGDSADAVAFAAAAAVVVQEDAAWRQRWSLSPDGEPLGSSGKGLDEQAMLLLRKSSPRRATLDAYPGMAQLYSYRKKCRKLNGRLTSSRINAESYCHDSEEAGTKTNSSFEEVEFVRGKIETLLRALPINAIRADLATFYDDMIADANQKRTAAGECVGRCIVELVPSPGFSPLCPPWMCSQYPPCEPKPNVVASLGRIASAILDARLESARGISSVNVAPRGPSVILAISSFFHGRLLFSHVAPSQRTTSDSDFMDKDRIRRYPSLLSDEKSSLLQKYLSRYRWMSNRVHSDYSSVSDSNDGIRSKFLASPPTTTAIDTIMSRVSKGGGKSMRGGEGCTTSARTGRFIPPPPLSMLNLSENVDGVHHPSLGHVWMPRVHLPCSDGGERLCTARVALFEVDEYDFLVFASDIALNGDIDGRTDISDAMATALASLSEQLGPAVSHLKGEDIHHSTKVPGENGTDSARDTDASQQVDGAYWGEPGVDIVFIDRLEGNLVLLSQYEGCSDPDVNISAKHGSKRQSKKKLVLPIPAEKSTQGNGASKSDDVAKDMSSMQYEHLDCRHLLASHLPIDVILALDEMLREMERLSRCSRHGEEHGDLGRFMPKNTRMIETCTFLPQGWVYGRAHQFRELYCIFDPNTYVTLADVQKAALRIRSELFNGALL